MAITVSTTGLITGTAGTSSLIGIAFQDNTVLIFAYSGGSNPTVSGKLTGALNATGTGNGTGSVGNSSFTWTATKN